MGSLPLDADAATEVLITRIRHAAALAAGVQADQLWLVSALAEQVSADAVALLAGRRVPGTPPEHEVIDSAVDAEVAGDSPLPHAPLGRDVILGLDRTLHS